MMTTRLPTDDLERRWFYATVVAATLAVVGSSWWWNEADFPLPEKMEIRWGARYSSKPGWVLRQREKLWERKTKPMAANLRLEGSVWEDEESGGILEFGADGRMYWQRFPEGVRFEGEWVEDALRKLEGTRYQENGYDVIEPHRFSSLYGSSRRLGVAVRLIFPDHFPYSARVALREDVFYFAFGVGEGLFESVTLTFTRQIGP